ncbi:hypothetical protein ILFOPFJJ_06352 [Ensifer psoraleae]|nr:hypothetical protein [Sinorhizobium psoraleae]
MLRNGDLARLQLRQQSLVFGVRQRFAFGSTAPHAIAAGRPLLHVRNSEFSQKPTLGICRSSTAFGRAIVAGLSQ